MRTTMAMLITALAAVAAPALAAPPADTFLQNLPDTFSTPVAVRAANDGSGRLFVVQKGGSIYVVKNGRKLATPFLTLSVTTASESGLLGLAFHPNFGKVGLTHNDEFYISYTRPSGDPRLGSTPDQAIARCTVPTLTSDVATTPCTLVMRAPDLAGNHNGGDIHFGSDGYLYWSMGDSGDQNDPHGFAECLWKKPADNNFSPGACTESGSATNYFLLGKMLRIDVDNRGAAPTAEMCGSIGINPAQYSIPASNPYGATSNTCDEIWDFGFRNPWRFSFDRQTHDLIIGDVGQGTYEEIDVHPSASAGGIDFGWGRCEGRHYFHTSGSGTTCPATTSTRAPAIEYPHSGFGCAVTGGFVYRGATPSLQGIYFYSDSCSGRLWWADATGSVWDGTGIHDTNLSSSGIYGFGESEAGEVYIAFGGGTVSRITTDTIFKDDFEL